MKRLLIPMLLAFSGAAFAHNCPNEMKAIDAALPKAKISAAQMGEVKKLRAEGETLHKAGKHTESVEALSTRRNAAGHSAGVFAISCGCTSGAFT